MNDSQPENKELVSNIKEFALKRYDEKYLSQFAHTRRGARIPRSTYTKTVAMIMKPYYDLFAQTGQPVCIPYSDFITNNPTTIIKKAADGIKYLMERSEQEEERVYYMRLRARMKFVPSDKIEEGIWIQPVEFIPPSLMRNPRLVEAVKTSENFTAFKSRLETWLTSSEEGDMFSEKVVITAQESEEVKLLLEAVSQRLVEAGFEPLKYDVTCEKVRVMK